MIIVFDSTVFVSDPFLGSTAWKILAHAARQGHIRLYTTEAVELEAVAGYTRRINEASAAFDHWLKKHAGILGSQAPSADAMRELQQRPAKYADDLKSILAAIPVEVLPLPLVDHRTLIERATGRIPPCDQKGDGYRDTLNWFTLLDLVKTGDDRILWVTTDRDFADVDGVSLHPLLSDELAQIGTGDRITLSRSLHDAALNVASTIVETGADLRKVQGRLALDTLTNYVLNELLTDLPAIEVSAMSLALPIAARAPRLAVVNGVTESSFEVKSTLEEGESAVEVTLICDTTIVVETTPDSNLGEAFAYVTEEGEVGIAETTKALRFTALIAVDKYDRPTSGELTSVRALDDDPGHSLWRSALRRRLLKTHDLPPGIFDAIQYKGLPPGIFDAIRSKGLPPGIFDAIRIRNAALPPGVLDAIRNAGLPPGIFDAIRNTGLPPGIFDAIRNTGLPPGTFDAIRRAQNWGPANTPPTDESPDPSSNGENDSPEDAADDENPPK